MYLETPCFNVVNVAGKNKGCKVFESIYECFGRLVQVSLIGDYIRTVSPTLHSETVVRRCFSK